MDISRAYQLVIEAARQQLETTQRASDRVELVRAIRVVEQMVETAKQMADPRRGKKL